MNRLAWTWRAGCAAAVVVCCLWAAAAAAAACRDEVGAERAEIYVRQCLAISSGTHPPCNAANACATIGQHIQAMCANAGADAPGWCAAYRTAAVPNPPPAMPAPRPGFACAAATSPVEREMCQPGHDWVADLDRAMAEAYAAALARAADAGAVRSAQRGFLQERQGCSAPEPGRTPAGRDLLPCIASLTRERVDELSGQSGWDSFDFPDTKTCAVSFGRDGWDQLALELPARRVVYSEMAGREGSQLRVGDKVEFDVDGRLFPARLDLPAAGNDDAVPTIASADPQLPDAMLRGAMARVRRNGKVILRAPLAGLPAAAQRGAAMACAKRPR